jgi:predicted transcriptional regulator
MDVLYRLGHATAAEIHAGLREAPTYTTVRGLLRILEAKGHVTHTERARQYLYAPSTPRQDAGASHLTHVVRTFFGGSPADAMSALLGSHQVALSKEELERLSDIIEQAQRRRK